MGLKDARAPPLEHRNIMLSNVTKIMVDILTVVCVVSKTILGCVLASSISTCLSVLVHSLSELDKACAQLTRGSSPSFSSVAQHMTYCPHGQDKMSDQSIARRGSELFVWFLARSSGVESLMVAGA